MSCTVFEGVSSCFNLWASSSPHPLCPPVPRNKSPPGLEGRTQRYRESLGKLEKAAVWFNARKDDLKFVAHLGDIIDGHFTWPEGIPSLDKSRADLELVAKVFDTIELKKVHVVGNHCLQVKRTELLARLDTHASYYAFSPCPGWRVLVLDTTEVNTGPMEVLKPDDERNRQLTMEATLWWDAPENATKPNRQPWNGMISEQQHDWLRQELQDAEQRGDRVIAFGHHPVGKGSGREIHMCWNSDEVEKTMINSKAFVAYLNGHDHVGGYADRDGRHFVTVEAVLECPEEQNAFARVDVYPDRIEIQGQGLLSSRVLPLLS